MKKRLHHLDNAKFMLITLVVIGHLIDVGATRDSEGARALFVFIYSFHMPLFIFLSGLVVSREKLTAKKALERATEFCFYGFLLKGILFAVPLLLGWSPKFSLLSDGGLPWYMFAMAAFYLSAWLLRSANSVLIGIASVVLSLLAGYDSTVGDFMYISRIIVFFPFFWLGYSLRPETVSNFVGKPSAVMASTAILVVFIATCISQTDFIYQFRGLFTGRNSYEAVRAIANCSWIDRGCAYCISLAMSFAVLSLTPKRAIPIISEFGKRTLQVYILHYIVIDMLIAFGFVAVLLSIHHAWIALVPIGVLLSLGLSIRFFEIPVKAISRELKSAA